MWPALFGAVVGGILALAGSLVVEIRKDRRRQLGAARLIVSQLKRSVIELEVKGEDSAEGGWHEGPHSEIRTSAWDAHAADFVGLLDQRLFDLVDLTHTRLVEASDWGFTQNEVKRLIAQADETLKAIEPVTRPTWVDRHVLCL